MKKVPSWEKQVLDRRKWRCTLKKAIAEVEEKRKNDHSKPFKLHLPKVPETLPIQCTPHGSHAFLNLTTNN